MRKLMVFVFLGWLLCGCAEQEVFETIADELEVPVMAQIREISVSLPDNAVAPVLENGGAQIYYGDGYEIFLQTLSAGDLNDSIRSLSGFEKDRLTILQTDQEGAARYEFVWACAGEKGDRLGRAVILDDGNYHYCMSVLRDAETKETSQIVWDAVFTSFALL